MQHRYVGNYVTQSEIDQREIKLSRLLVEWEKLRKLGKMYPIISSPPNLFKVNSLVDPWGGTKERITVDDLEKDIRKEKEEIPF